MRIAWASLIRRPTQTILTGITVALASAALIFSLATTAGLSGGLSLGLKRLGADLIVMPEKARASFEEQVLFSGVPVNVYMPKSVVGKITAIPGVRLATPQFFVQTLDAGCCTIEGATRLVGIDPKTDFVIRPWLNSHGLHSLGKNDMIVGGKIPNILGNQAGILGEKFKEVGRLDESGGGMDKTIFIRMDTAKRLAESGQPIPGLKSEKLPAKDLVSAVMVRIDNKSTASSVAANINAGGHFRIIAASEAARSTGAYIGLLRKVLFTLSGLLLFVALTAIAGRFLAMVFERRSEIGVYRAMGARKSDIFKLFIFEALLLTGAGSIVGIIAGILGVNAFSSMLADSALLPFLSLPVSDFMVYIAISTTTVVAVGLIAGLYPAYLCAKQDPALAISQGELD